jgi:hypothetical protein
MSARIYSAVFLIAILRKLFYAEICEYIPRDKASLTENLPDVDNVQNTVIVQLRNYLLTTNCISYEMLNDVVQLRNYLLTTNCISYEMPNDV